MAIETLVENDIDADEALSEEATEAIEAATEAVRLIDPSFDADEWRAGMTAYMTE